jgi:hypothetical protein
MQIMTAVMVPGDSNAAFDLAPTQHQPDCSQRQRRRDLLCMAGSHL